MVKRKRDGGKNTPSEFDLVASSAFPKSSKKAAKSSSLKQDIDYETLDLFQIMATAAVQGHYPIEQIIELCYSCGVDHGKHVSQNLRRNDRQIYSTTSVDYDETGSNSLTTLDEISSTGDLSNNGFTPGKIGRNNNLHFIEPSPPPSSKHSTSTELFPPYKGVKMIKSSVKRNELPRYESFIELYDKKIILGEFADALLAAEAHDRAMIRAIGPCICKEEELNFNIRKYCKDSINLFNCFDMILREQLFGTEWKGIQDCDFGFILLTFPTYEEVNKIRLSKLRHGFVKSNG